MWNSKKSVLLSLIFVYGFMLVFVALEATAPLTVQGFIETFLKNPALQIPLTAFLYTCLLPVGYALWLLRSLLVSVLHGQCFCNGNVVRLRRLSWCCFTVAVITFGYGFFYFPLMILTPFAAFVGLVVRVVKNAFQTALELQTENELTI